jgi:GNAT superfamily N-acetyltransferase
VIEIRIAREDDVQVISDIFYVAYGEDYIHPQFYDVTSLKRMIFSDDTVILVAEETETKTILGTASVVLDVGAHADLIAEFGRLVVHPDGRGQGIGKQLMTARINAVKDRIHVGIVENRCAHEFSQRISHRHDFRPVGLLPDKNLLRERESVAMYVRHFGPALELRRNHPHLIPEVYPLAKLALESCGLKCDAIVDAEARAYPHIEHFEIEEMKTELYPALLRFERGRVRHREIFGRMRLHYGLFQLQARHGHYLVAYRDGVMVGAVGFAIDERERTAKLFELVSLNDTPIRFLLEQLVTRCRDDRGVEYLDVDVSAFSPAMQRTLLEAGFLPAAYIPAMVFHDVERLDIVRMVRLLTPWNENCVCVYEAGQPIARVVGEAFRLRNALPRLTEAVAEAPLFAGLTEEQQRSVASIATLEQLAENDLLFHPGDPEDRVWVLLSGAVEIRSPQDEPVGTVGPLESLGEQMAISEQPHRVTARVQTAGEAMVFDRRASQELIRRRPDIGMILYRNLSRDLAEKLQRMNLKSSAPPTDAGR